MEISWALAFRKGILEKQDFQEEEKINLSLVSRDERCLWVPVIISLGSKRK